MMADRMNSEPAGLGNQAIESVSPLTNDVGQGHTDHQLTEQHRHERNGQIALSLWE